MNKKMSALVTAGVVMAMLLTGCQTKTLSNDQVKVSKYSGVEVKKIEKTAITDKEIDAHIENRLNQYAVTTEISDRAAQMGDVANIDYVGKKDGVAFEGGTAEKFDLELGSHRFIDGFEEGIVGHKVGETFDLNLKFPEGYRAQELAGQEVVFTVTLNKLTEKKLPELTDEFVAEKLSDEASTVEDYKKELKEELTEQSEKAYRANLRQEAWTAVLANAEVKEYPKDELKKYEDMLTEQYKSMAEMYQIEFADFLKQQLGMEEEAFKEKVKEAAQNQVKSDLVRDLLAENVEMDRSKEEYQKRYEAFAESYGFEDVDTFLKQMEENGNKEYLDELVLLEIVQDWVADHCKQV